MKRVILLRANPVNPDPPVEKAALALIKAGYDVIIIGWDRQEDYEIKKRTVQISDYSIEVINFGIKAQFGGGIKKNLFPLIAFQKRLQRWLVKNKSTYDIVHSFDFDTGFVAYKYAKRFNKKFVYHILDYYVDSHGLKGTVFENPIRKLENSVINFADATIICTEKRKDQIKGSFPKRLAVVHNTPSVAQIKHCENKTRDTGRIKIAYVGILSGSRLLKEIVDAVSENDGVELHVGGFGYLESFFEEKSLAFDNIYYYGRLTYDQTLSLENECDIMLAIYDPSVENHRYAAPNKFYESLMLGKPVLMVRETGMSEIVETNSVGALIDYSKDGFICGINELAARRSEWDSIGNRMKEIYRTQYSWEEMERRLIRIYTDLNNEENTDR